MTTFGKLRIVPSTNLGDLAAGDAEAVVYDWKPYYSLPGFALWAVVALLMVALKENRVPSVLLILVPILIVSLLWTLVKELIPGSGSAAILFDQIMASATFGFGVLWLVAHKIGNRNRFVALVLGLGVMLTCWVIGLVSYLGVEFSNDTVGTLVYFGLLAVGMTVGLTLAGRGCRWRYSGPRFVLKLLLWTAVTSLAAIYAFVLIFMIFNDSARQWQLLVTQIPIIGGILGLISFLVMLPYAVLAAKNSFFRRRLFAYANLNPLVAGEEAVATPELQKDVDWRNT